MEPYLFIDEKEWKYILDTYEKDDVIEELSKTYISMSDPIEISEKDTLKSLNKLKGVKCDLLIDGKWFQETKEIRDTNSHLNILNETIKEIIRPIRFT